MRTISCTSIWIKISEEAAADDEVGEISVDDLKDIIKDVMADVLGGGDGEDMEIDVDGDGDIDVAIDGDDDGDVEVEDDMAEAKKDDKMDLFTILLLFILGIKVKKFVHSVISPKIFFNLCIALSTEYNSENAMVKWLGFSSCWIIIE